MSNQKLRMKYHPAKKEIHFNRVIDEKVIDIRNDSVLSEYMNKKGSFVLQDHGNDFFEDIARAFDQEKNIHVEVTTTKNDFEDLLQMINFYNDGHEVKFSATLLAELPDMDRTYDIVKKHGESSIEILEKTKKNFTDINRNSSVVKDCVQSFSDELQKEIENIRSKIDSMQTNTVNLCFTGVYSAGKSAMINAILGYPILYEADNSSTARMFIIKSPKDGKTIRIVFSIQKHDQEHDQKYHAELLWNEGKNIFEFSAAPNENPTRDTIQETINKYKSAKKHIQLYEILKVLNSETNIHGAIRIFFPIPLDNKNVQFAIYDTPGTDSNYEEHKTALKDALSEQTHSILIFIALADRLEGEGNNALLSYLKEAEKKDNKVSIDIARSLFVINKADASTNDKLKSVHTSKITDHAEDSFSIKLADKKLFFVSARYGYIAKAYKTKDNSDSIAVDADIEMIGDDYAKVCKPNRGRYYQNNRIATSEYSTNKLIERCDKELAAAEKISDTARIFYICSGLFALESEITTYGEKYASAVRAFAIIDSVNKALATVSKNTSSLKAKNHENLDQVIQEIAEIRKTIYDGIKKSYKKHEISSNTSFPNDIIKELHLDSEYLMENINKPSLSFIDGLLQKCFRGILGKCIPRFLNPIFFNNSHKKEITNKIAAILDDYTQDFLRKSTTLLQKKCSEFIEDINKAIEDNINISEVAKKFLKDIHPPEIRQNQNLSEFADIYDSHKRTDKIFMLIKFDNMDKEGFIETVDRKLAEISTSISNDFKDAFRETLVNTLTMVENEVTQNIEKYSKIMQAKIDDKKAMEQLSENFESAIANLENCQKELDAIIWRVNDDG